MDGPIASSPRAPRPYDEFDVNRSKRRMMLAARPGFSGTMMSVAMAQLIKDDPVVASYDFVLDVTASPTGATQADLDIVLAAYHAVPREVGLKYGCYVSNDPHFHMWVASMSELFGDRECLTFGTVDQAVAFLDRKLERD